MRGTYKQNTNIAVIYCTSYKDDLKEGGWGAWFKIEMKRFGPNGKLPNVYHMQQAGRERKWYLKWLLF